MSIPPWSIQFPVPCGLSLAPAHDRESKSLAIVPPLASFVKRTPRIHTHTQCIHTHTSSDKPSRAYAGQDHPCVPSRCPQEPDSTAYTLDTNDHHLHLLLLKTMIAPLLPSATDYLNDRQAARTGESTLTAHRLWPTRKDSVRPLDQQSLRFTRHATTKGAEPTTEH